MHLYFHMKKICAYTQAAPNHEKFMISAIIQSNRAHHHLMSSVALCNMNVRPLDMPRATRYLNAIQHISCSFAPWVNTWPNNSIKSACAYNKALLEQQQNVRLTENMRLYMMCA